MYGYPLPINGALATQLRVPQTQALREQYQAVLQFLNMAPSLSFSDTGRANICKRFGISREHLEVLLDSIMLDAKPPRVIGDFTSEEGQQRG